MQEEEHMFIYNEGVKGNILQHVYLTNQHQKFYIQQRSHRKQITDYSMKGEQRQHPRKPIMVPLIYCRSLCKESKT
jgi:hypothetical protein